MLEKTGAFLVAVLVFVQHARTQTFEYYTTPPTVYSPVYPARIVEGPSLNGHAIGQILEQADKQLQVDRLPKLEPAKRKLQTSLNELEQFIVKGSPNGNAWSQFLRIADIEKQLQAETPSYSALLDLETNMRQNYLGLEYRQFMALREAIQEFSLAARFHNQEEKFIKFLKDSMEHTISKARTSHKVDDDLVQDLVSLVHNLNQSNLAPTQTQQLCSLFSSQNVHISVDERLIARQVTRRVAQPQNVDEMILGTHVLGTAFMDGNVSARLLPMNDGIGLQLDLSACLTSQSRGYNRGVVVNSTSASPVLASKQVYISDKGVSSPPASIFTQLETQIHSIEHRSRLVRRIASRKAAQQKPQSEAIAEGRMQSRICQEFTQQVDQQVSQAQPKLADLRNKSFPELKRFGIKQPTVALSSTNSAVRVGARHAEAYQFGALGSCPFPRPSQATAVGEFHQSALNNTIATMLGGRTIRNKSLGDLVKQFTGKIPESLSTEIEGEEWSLTFNPAEPVRIQFVDDMIAITVRLVRMTRGSQSLSEALSIKAVYYPTLDNERLTLTRQGEVEVSSDNETKGTRATTMRSFVKNKFEKTFPTNFTSQPISLANLQSRFPQAANLRLEMSQVRFRIGQGWLQVALQL